jgi:putative transposase
MARQLRLFLPGVAAHVIQRGVNRGACFRHEGDYLLYLLHLRELSAKVECAIHAYCLMTNHVHLLLTPSSDQGCQGMMKDLGQRYSQYFNRTYGRSGPLWDGRYRSCLAQSALYVLACYRYIELNPVRAGMVAHPAQYAWSSYRANAEGHDDRLATPHSEFLALGSEAGSRQHGYRMLFDQTLDPLLVESIRASTSGGYPLASEGFKANLAAAGCRLEPSPPGPKPRR